LGETQDGVRTKRNFKLPEFSRTGRTTNKRQHPKKKKKKKDTAREKPKKPNGLKPPRAKTQKKKAPRTGTVNISVGHADHFSGIKRQATPGGDVAGGYFGCQAGKKKRCIRRKNVRNMNAGGKYQKQKKALCTVQRRSGGVREKERGVLTFRSRRGGRGTQPDQVGWL